MNKANLHFGRAFSHTTIRLGALIALSLSLINCSDGSRPGNLLKWGLFADRPIAPQSDLYIVLLNAPALLSVADINGDVITIPKDKQDQLLTEQRQFEASLAADFPDIQIVYRYRLSINGYAIFANSKVTERIMELPSVRATTLARHFTRPQSPKKIQAAGSQQNLQVNSVSFIGGVEAQRLGFTGKGLSVGVLDTGVDYTHKMLGGPGTAEAFTSVDPSKPHSLFPNNKVTGGIDLVGTDYDPSSTDLNARLPKPDGNPIDEAGHGTHVAGTVAGRGDGVLTYDGVAPDAQIHAIKVFGKGGGTGDAIVIAGFEYALDPNGDLKVDDRLDILNLSLGGGFGQPQALYNQAIQNVTRAGIVVVASAGNSGDVPYIVGSPSTTGDALSVAASIDGAEVNWRFAASIISMPSNPNFIVRAVEGPISRPVGKSDGIGGELVDIGFADKPLTDEVKAKVAGRVALIERGNVPFQAKLTLAKEAGAIGALVYSNAPGEPIPMGGEGDPIDIPAIMVTQSTGKEILREMQRGPVSIQFKTSEFIEMPEGIDTITDFSSRGPRSEDNLFKPEISAPGQNIMSAAMGGGTTGTLMDGTSMAAPHVAGALALIKQAHPTLSAYQLKAIVMNTATLLRAKDLAIPMTAQGAGRIQVLQAIRTPIVAETASISLGGVQHLGRTKVETRMIRLRNLTNRPIILAASTTSSLGLSLKAPIRVSVGPMARVDVPIRVQINLRDQAEGLTELNGQIQFTAIDSGASISVPAMAIRTQASRIRASATGSDKLILQNLSAAEGLALPFNLIAEDDRKAIPIGRNQWKARDCDLKSAGYRIIKTMTKLGFDESIQFAIKLHTPLSTWVRCSVSVLIDHNGDGLADQELAGILARGIEGIEPKISSLLLDSMIAREIRLAYEQELSSGKLEVKLPDYTPAAIASAPIAPFEQSSVVVLQAPLKALAKTRDGRLRINVATQSETGENVEADDFLGEPTKQWHLIAGDFSSQPYMDLEEVVIVNGKANAQTRFTRGTASGRLVIYYPVNEYRSGPNGDAQEQIISH